MINIKCKDKFLDKILSRGYDYYKNGLVASIHEKDNVIVAEVTGTKTYECFAKIQDLELISAGCSCPYANEGHYCKHIAALLYYLEKNNHSKVMNLLEEYSYDEKTCLKLVEEYIKQNEVKKAITILKQNLKETNKRFFAEKLSEIYYKENMTKEYKEIFVSATV